MPDSVARPEAYLFDWDGTLIDSLPLKIENAAALFAEELGADPEEAAASYARHSGVPRRVLFDRIAVDCIGETLSDEIFSRFSTAFSSANRERVFEKGELRPGTMETVRDLRSRDAVLYVSTSAAQDEVEPLAGHFGLKEYCSGILGSRPGFSKGPDHVRYVAERHGLAGEQLLGVGDDLADMELFLRAGIVAIGITGTRSKTELLDAGAVAVIDTLPEVIGIGTS